MLNSFSLVVLGFASASYTNAFWRMPSDPLMINRIDPIVTPGKIGLHAHVFHGANTAMNKYDPAHQAKATCTTIEVQDDLSSYWYPQLYYQHTNGSFSAIRTYANMYYIQRPSFTGEKLVAFPIGLKMIAGSPMRRTYNASNVADNAVSYVCQDFAGGHDGDPNWKQRNDFFPQNCPNSMRAQVLFPPCWDGKRLSSSDNSHVSYPLKDVEHGKCPPSHPKRFITLFIEAVFDVQNFPYRKNGWTFSFGDQTGFGFHADFISQWDTKVLQDAIDQCTDPATQGAIDKCPPLVKSVNKARANACQPLHSLVNEDYGVAQPIPKLTGDNPIWTGTGAKPTCGCTQTNPGIFLPNSTLASGFTRAGCVSEPSNGRLLTGASMVDAKAMTGEVCSKFCASKGFKLAATEYAQECYCGNSFANGGTGQLIEPWLCDAPCKGRSTENCGGSRTLTLYKASAAKRSKRHAEGLESQRLVH